MKITFLFIAIAFAVASTAQVTKVSLQASGLTCSMCSNSINKALKTLDFVDKIDANVKTYTFEILFKENSSVDFDKIKRKVEDAGFSVSGFIATIQFNNVEVKNNQPVIIDNKTFLFANMSEQVLNGPTEIRILDKGFVSSKEYKRNDSPVFSPGTYHAII